jgi:hypothetical protein
VHSFKQRYCCAEALSSTVATLLSYTSKEMPRAELKPLPDGSHLSIDLPAQHCRLAMYSSRRWSSNSSSSSSHMG